MKDLAICAPAFVSIMAQTGEQATWERLGIGGLSIAVTVFIWRHFVGREETAQKARDERDARDEAARQAQSKLDAAERNRLLEVQNTLQNQVVELLKSQFAQADQTAQTLVASQRALVTANKDSTKRHEDAVQSLKEVVRKIPAVREVVVKSSATDPVHTVIDDQ